MWFWGVGIYPMLYAENNVGMLEGFFDYFRECFVFLFESILDMIEVWV